MLLLLLACAHETDTAKVETGTPDSDADTDTDTDTDSDSDADTDTDSDSDADTDTDTDSDTDTDPGTLDLDRGNCEALLDPWTVSTADDALATWLAFGEGANLITAAGQIAAYGDAACPLMTTEEDSTQTTGYIDGDCTASTGWSFFGSAVIRVTLSSGVPTSYTYSYEDFGFDYDGGADAVSYRIRGDAEITASGSTFDLTWASAATGAYADIFPTSNMTFSSSTTSAGNSSHTEGYARIASTASGTPGDFCYDADYSGVSDCGSIGTVTISGGTVATLAYGAKPCDCHEVTLDGVDAGEACE